MGTIYFVYWFTNIFLDHVVTPGQGHQALEDALADHVLQENVDHIPGRRLENTRKKVVTSVSCIGLFSFKCCFLSSEVFILLGLEKKLKIKYSPCQVSPGTVVASIYIKSNVRVTEKTISVVHYHTLQSDANVSTIHNNLA